MVENTESIYEFQHFLLRKRLKKKATNSHFLSPIAEDRKQIYYSTEHDLTDFKLTWAHVLLCWDCFLEQIAGGA